MFCKGARPEEVKHEEDKKHEFGRLYHAMTKKISNYVHKLWYCESPGIIMTYSKRQQFFTFHFSPNIFFRCRHFEGLVSNICNVSGLES